MSAELKKTLLLLLCEVLIQPDFKPNRAGADLSKRWGPAGSARAFLVFTGAGFGDRIYPQPHIHPHAQMYAHNVRYLQKWKYTETRMENALMRARVCPLDDSCTATVSERGNGPKTDTRCVVPNGFFHMLWQRGIKRDTLNLAFQSTWRSSNPDERGDASASRTGLCVACFGAVTVQLCCTSSVFLRPSSSWWEENNMLAVRGKRCCCLKW